MNGLVGVAIIFLAHRVLPFDRHPLYPWGGIGSGAFVEIVNGADYALSVTVTAPEVDSATRSLGVVGARDTLFAKLPYADAVVMVHIGTLDVPLKVDRPLVAQISVREKQ